ncbi:hypothetical protein GCM10009624_21690 [Gordonia sinesedis]
MNPMEYDTTDGTDATSADDYGARRSPGLALAGLATLAVAGWGLADGPVLPDAATLGWAAVTVGLVVGLVLIVTGAHSSRR